MASLKVWLLNKTRAQRGRRVSRTATLPTACQHGSQGCTFYILCRSVAHALRLPQPEPAGPARNRSQLRWSLKQSLLLAGWAWKTKPDQLKASLGAARASGACHMLPNSACQFEAKAPGKHCRSSNYGLHRLPMASIHESRLDLTHQTPLTEMLGLQTAGSQFSI